MSMHLTHRKQIFREKIFPVGNKLISFALVILKNRQEAEDAVQEVFIKLWNKFEELNTIDNPEAYAMRVLKNHCLDRLKAKQLFSLPNNDAGTSQIDNDTPYNKIANEETGKMIQKLVDQLPALQRMVIQLHDVQEYSTEETGKILQMAPNAVRVNLSRARQTIRKNFNTYQVYEKRRIRYASGKIL